MNDRQDDDPLGVDRDRQKLEQGLDKEGPPVAKMATTYGSSFVTSEDQADAIAADTTDDGRGAHAGLGGPGHPGGTTDRPPAEAPPTHRGDPSGEG